MEVLFNYQYDYIKLKLYNVDTNIINWCSLIPHENLKRHYTLNSNGQYFDKNFDLFIDKGNNITIRTSIPYLVYGHNFKSFDSQSLSRTLNSLTDLLGIDLSHAKIHELEFGGYHKIKDSSQSYIKNLVGIKDYEIEKSTSTMKMFGDSRGFHFKVYDPIANAKSKRTFSISQYPNKSLIKYELKMSNSKDFTVEELCTQETFEDFKLKLNSEIGNLIIQEELKHAPLETSIIHILYATLKNMEQKLGLSVYSQISNVLDKMRLTPSQKSKRKKTLFTLETTYNLQSNKR
ncbi:hypothetical protein [Gelidibacter pelagius]|uniref:Replication initiation factor n=1 Tax=Gelidibacter pelagius TaxID=2819985 RepID=A0ABS3SM74_9FLAO|nr:hypothetical protein [Gelidibacter pelagius]MBO3096812.1 hypothetical protein [Gelidibacter pelagius]